MPWTVDDPPPPARNRSRADRLRCVESANAVLRDGGWESLGEEARKELEQQAVFACISVMDEHSSEDFGGPGSGHWGHKGTPGSRGGSSPGRMRGSGRVNRDYFEVGPGKSLVAELSPKDREKAIAIMTSYEVQPRHLSGLQGITTEGHSDYKGKWVWEDKYGKTTLPGLYDMKTQKIHMNPEYAGHFPTLSHELGHHVTINSPLVRSRNMSPLNNIASGIGRRKLPSAEEMKNMGLREYSFTTSLEFKADVWHVYQRGSAKQRANLAGYIGVNSLDDIFWVTD